MWQYSKFSETLSEWRGFPVGTAFGCLLLLAGTAGAGVRISEVVPSNGGSYRDPGTGTTPDWIELHNTGPAPIALGGYGLSDNSDQPFKWVFPTRTLAAGAYLIVCASGQERRTGPVYHTNFSLSGDGEMVTLTEPGGVRADTAPAVALQRDMSYGRAPADGAWRYFPTPTPNAANTGPSYAEVLHQAPEFSATGGFSDAALALTLAAPRPGTVVRYTLDGSEPGESSPLYTAPLTLTSRAAEANVLSLIQGTSTANQHTDGWKPPLGAVRKARLVRARAFKEDAVPSATVSHSYFIGPEARRTDGLAVMSLMTARDGLFDYNTGIYMLGKVFDNYVAAHPGETLTGHTPANYTQRGGAWRRECAVEFFEADGTRAWAAPAWLDIKGQSSRSFRQKSFGLDFLSATPPERAVNYPLFPGLVKTGKGGPLTVFQHLRLRNSGNDWAFAAMRDGFCHQLADGLGLDRMAWRPVTVYLDGEYWGILELREQQDPEYFAAHYGVDPKEVVILNGNGSVEEGTAADAQVYLGLRTYAETHDLSKPEFMAHMEERMDVENFLTYEASEIFFGNADWPHNNTRLWRVRRPDNYPDRDAVLRGHDGRWRWMLFDLDLAVAHPWAGSYSENTLSYAISATGRPGTNAPWATSLLRALLKNPDTKSKFASIMADLLNSNYKAARAVALVDNMQASLEPGMAEHIRRWQSQTSLTAWKAQVSAVRTWASQREPNVRQHFTATLGLGGYAPLTVDCFPAGGGGVRVNNLRIQAGLPGVADPVYPWSGVYFRQIPVTLHPLPARGMEFEKWVTPTGESTDPTLSVMLAGSTLVTAHFRVAQPRWETIPPRPGGGMTVAMRSGPDEEWQLQFSTDLVRWENRETFLTDGAGVWRGELAAPLSGNPSGYYRAVRVP